MQHKERVFLVAFGGSKKELSNQVRQHTSLPIRTACSSSKCGSLHGHGFVQVEVLILEKNEQSIGRRATFDNCPHPSPFENRSSVAKLAAQIGSEARACPLDSVARQNLASVLDHHGSSRRSISESCLVDSNPASGNVSLRKQFNNAVEHGVALTVHKSYEREKCERPEDVSIFKNSSMQVC